MQSCHSMVTGRRGLETVKIEVLLEGPYGTLKKRLEERDGGFKEWQPLQVDMSLESKRITFLVVLVVDDK
jgi:hypothetical protein